MSFLGGLFDAVTKPVASLVGGLFGSTMSYVGQKDTNSANAAMSREQMAFQQHMSDTAHQREILDLQAAGLNPILSATGGNGASTPAGSMATMENPMEKALNSGLATAQLYKDLDLADSQISLQGSQKLANEANTELSHNSAKESAERFKLLSEQIRTQKALTDKVKAETRYTDSNTEWGSPLKVVGEAVNKVSKWRPKPHIVHLPNHIRKSGANSAYSLYDTEYSFGNKSFSTGE